MKRARRPVSGAAVLLDAVGEGEGVGGVVGEVRPTDTPAPWFGGWSWGFNEIVGALVMLREPYFDDMNFVDLDGRPLPLPDGVHSTHSILDGGAG